MPPRKSPPRDDALDAASDHELERLRLLVLGAQRDGNRQFADLLRESGVTPAQAEILGVLAVHRKLTLSGLGRLIMSESASPSRSVDLLVRRGLINRVQAERDRRQVELELTPAGSALLAPIARSTEELGARLSVTLTVKERAQLARLLGKLVAGTEVADVLERRFGGTGRRQ